MLIYLVFVYNTPSPPCNAIVVVACNYCIKLLLERVILFMNVNVPLVVNTSRSFPHSWLITGFVTRLTRRVPLVKQELPILPENLIWPPVFSRVFSFMCMFCKSLFVLLHFSFGHCVLCSSSIYGFW